MPAVASDLVKIACVFARLTAVVAAALGHTSASWMRTLCSCFGCHMETPPIAAVSFSKAAHDCPTLLADCPRANQARSVDVRGISCITKFTALSKECRETDCCVIPVLYSDLFCGSLLLCLRSSPNEGADRVPVILMGSSVLPCLRKKGSNGFRKNDFAPLVSWESLASRRNLP